MYQYAPEASGVIYGKLLLNTCTNTRYVLCTYVMAAAAMFSMRHANMYNNGQPIIMQYLSIYIILV